MPSALFINGIYDGVLTEILAAQEARGGGESLLQPYKGQVITMLKERQPTPESPITLYVSTTENLSRICYIAQIIRWEDKRELSNERRDEVRQQLETYQRKEVTLFTGEGRLGHKPVNLITIRALRRPDTLHPTSLLQKTSDRLTLKRRTRSGGWSEVHDLGDLIDLPPETQEQYDSVLAESVKTSKALSDVSLRERLSFAVKLPEKVQVVSIGYRRNPDVIVAVLRRANGLCERCGEIAPFFRRSDSSPYLEVHHWIPLSKGGEDTVDNAAALCPNCHREVHHGEGNGEPDGAANGSQPIRSDTNRTSSAAGSRR